MSYLIKEIFYTLQGEGMNAGRSAVFCRFTGCNLWTGIEEHRSKAICQFCDTDFRDTNGTKGGKYGADDLACSVDEEWPGGGKKLVVLTGGEPLLQVDGDILDALHDRDFEIAVETNGTIAVDQRIDWVCVSPKALTTQVLDYGDEVKVVVPQIGLDLERIGRMNFKHFLVQPMDGHPRSTEIAVQWCLDHPQWRLSLQTHKMIGVR